MRPFEKELWDAINDYASAVGGDPSAHVHGNTPRMRAVAAVGRVVDQVSSWQRIDDVVIEELARGGDAAAAAAGAARVEVARLRASLLAVVDFLRGVARRPELGDGAAVDLIEEAEALRRVLGESDVIA